MEKNPTEVGVILAPIYLATSGAKFPIERTHPSPVSEKVVLVAWSDGTVTWRPGP